MNRFLRNTGYCLMAFPVSLVAFVVIITSVSLGLGLLVTVAGVFVLVGAAYAARGFAHVERLRLAARDGRPVEEPVYRTAGPDDSGLRRALLPLRDAQSWRDLLWSVLGFVTGTAVFVVVVTWWATVLNGLTYWYWERFVSNDDNTTLTELIGLGDSQMADNLLMLGVGLVAAVTLPLVTRGCAAFHGGLATLLLEPGAAGTSAPLADEGRPVPAPQPAGWTTPA